MSSNDTHDGHLLGWGPWSVCGINWPLAPWRFLFYAPRPDLHATKTRKKEWQMLKSQWRYFHAAFFYLGPPSHVLFNIKYPYIIVQMISVLVQVVGAYINLFPWGGDTEISSSVPIVRTSFLMTSFLMSLLLSFRINQVYARWQAARQSLAGVGNGTTSIFMTMSAWLQDQPEKHQLLDDIRRYCIIYPYSILQVVRGDSSLDTIASSLLSPAETKVYSGSRKGRQVVAIALRSLIKEANLPIEQFISVETIIQSTIKSSGDAVRMKFQAMPQGVSLCCSGFVMIWCLLLPFAMCNYQQKYVEWPCIIAVAVISLLLLATDEVASQLEDPFPLLPMQDIVNTFERDINRVQDELKGISSAIRQWRAEEIGGLTLDNGTSGPGSVHQVEVRLAPLKGEMMAKV